MNHKNDFKPFVAEVEDEFTYNSEDKSMKNDLKLALNPKGIDLRYQFGFNTQKNTGVIRNELAY